MSQTDRNAGLVGNTGIKAPVRVATTAAITLSGAQTIDGIAVVTDDRVLVKNQASSVDNGIYVADSGSWSRAKDCDGQYDLKNGTLVLVRSGTTNGNKIFKCTSTDPIVVETSTVDFTVVDIEFSGNIQAVWCGTAGGTVNALTLTPSTAVTALTAGLSLLFKSGAGANTTAVTIAVSGLTATTAQLNGAAMVAGDIEANQWYMAVYEAGGTFQVSKIGIPALLHALTIDGAVTASGAWTHSGTVTMSGKSMYWAKGADIASAAPLVIGSDGNYFDVTGTTGFAAMTVPAGMLFMLQFDGALTLTHHATNLNLPGAANITTVAGDRMICFATAANTVHALEYVRADGSSLLSSYGTEVALTSGTTVELSATIPSWAKELIVVWRSLSTNGTNAPMLQIGDSGGYKATGYAGHIESNAEAGATFSTGFHLNSTTFISSGVLHGVAHLYKMSNHNWGFKMNSARTDIDRSFAGAGWQSLTNALDRIRFSTVGASDTYDAGAATLWVRG